MVPLVVDAAGLLAYDAPITSPRLPPKLFAPQVHTRGLGIPAVRVSIAGELVGYRPTCEGVYISLVPHPRNCILSST